MADIRSSLAALGIVACALGCLDLAHTNPFDPATPIDVSLTGPDSAYSLQQIIPFSFTSGTQWPGVVGWRSTNEALLHSLGDGRFGVVGFAPAPNDTASVVVSLGTHTATHRVVVSQRVGGFTFGCPTSGGPCVFPLGSRDAAIHFEAHDANGFRMVAPYSVQVASSQPSVMRVDGSVAAPALGFTVTVSPLATGTCWFIASSAGRGVSVFVTVR
jgi:hypothetical protein